MFAGKRSKEDDEVLKGDPPNDGVQPSYVITVSCNSNFPKHNCYWFSTQWTVELMYNLSRYNLQTYKYKILFICYSLNG